MKKRDPNYRVPSTKRSVNQENARGASNPQKPEALLEYSGRKVRTLSTQTGTSTIGVVGAAPWAPASLLAASVIPSFWLIKMNQLERSAPLAKVAERLVEKANGPLPTANVSICN